MSKGFDYRQLVSLTPDAKKTIGALDPRFGTETLFSEGFSGRFGVRFIYF
ncbi:MAG: hypothetical protein HYS04_15865 [Acidobacteria bacterium]|nr:hypothetical protein [Acidobacteriota bacterium]